MSVGTFRFLEIDDSILENLRLAVVAGGYFPDLRAFQPETPANRLAFQAAKDAIVAGGKQLINTVATGISELKGEMLVNTFYIHRVSRAQGSQAVFDTGDVPKAGGGFEWVTSTGRTSDVTYEIRYLTKSQQYADIMSNIILGLLGGGNKYLKVYDGDTGTEDTDRTLLINDLGEVDLDVYDYKEYVHTLVVKDAWVVASTTNPDGISTVINPNIVPIQQIDGILNTDSSEQDNVQI